MKILVINAGSSSLKYQLFNMKVDSEVLAKGLCERIGIEGSIIKHKVGIDNEIIVTKPIRNHTEAIKLVLDILVSKENGVIGSLDEIGAVGHRVVHGGERFNSSVIIDEDVKNAIEEYCELAPLHNPPNLVGINVCEKMMPNIPQVAVFDTAFHQTLQPKAYLYAIPYIYYEKYKIRKYGFHGTSHRYVANKAAQILNRSIEELKIITLHLGNGSSVAAVDKGISVDTSMGFTPLDGVVMGTRSGKIDPSALTYIMRKENMSIDEAEGILNKKSGILGISGISSDFRDIAIASDKGNERAILANDMFVHSVKGYIGLYASIMGGVDVLVFTAGVGENQGDIRQKIVNGQEFLGIKIDPIKNNIKGIEADISADNARVKTLVIPTNEELMIANDTMKLIIY